MPLSWLEIASIVIGLGGGYWLVSRIIERHSAPDWTPEDFSDQTSKSSGSQSDPGHGDRAQNGPSSGEEPRRREASGPPKPWWEVLDVPRIATRAEISHAYKRRISEYHPDKVAHLGEEIRAVAERRSKEINVAYEEAMRLT